MVVRVSLGHSGFVAAVCLPNQNIRDIGGAIIALSGRFSALWLLDRLFCNTCVWRTGP